MADDEIAIDPGVEARIRRRQTVRLAVIGLLVIIAAALALDNFDNVRIGWVVGNSDAPLVVVLVVAFLLGLAIGWLTGRHDRKATS